MSAPLKRDGANEATMAKRARDRAAYHADLPANRAIGRAKAARRRRLSPDAVSAYQAQWRAAHRAELAEYFRAYRRRHPGRHRVSSILGTEAHLSAPVPPIRVRTETSARAPIRKAKRGR